jgi:hypothetical protein
MKGLTTHNPGNFLYLTRPIIHYNASAQINKSNRAGITHSAAGGKMMLNGSPTTSKGRPAFPGIEYASYRLSVNTYGGYRLGSTMHKCIGKFGDVNGAGAWEQL